MHHLKKLIHNHTFLLSILILLGALSHFIGLTWGQPYFFHPDERNIAGAVAQLHFPNHMNPQFFAYGSLPLYAIYFLGLIVQLFTGTATVQMGYVPFGEAIMLSRFYSALLATLLIPLVYYCGVKLKNKQTGLLSAFFVTMSTGVIQFAHFGTFEMWLTFFSLVLFALSLLFLQKPTLQSAVALSAIFGVLLATKITSLVMLPLIMILFLYGAMKQKTFFKKILHLLSYLVLFLVSSGSFFL